MLSISNKYYSTPLRQKDGTNVYWRVNRGNGSNECLNVKKFSYTIRLQTTTSDGNTYAIDRMTFLYDGSSVKPAPRTLRIFGSEGVARITKLLANATKPEVDLLLNAAIKLACNNSVYMREKAKRIQETGSEKLM